MSDNNLLTTRGQTTLIRLEAALKRLLEGKAERTLNDGRLSLSRINSEAGLSSGAIYYYDDFVDKVKKLIYERKLENSIELISSVKPSIDKMRQQRDKERDLKESYKAQRDSIKAFCDNVLAKNAQLEFALFEAQNKIEQLEKEKLKNKFIDINTRRSK